LQIKEAHTSLFTFAPFSPKKHILEEKKLGGKMSRAICQYAIRASILPHLLFSSHVLLYSADLIGTDHKNANSTLSGACGV
jgi:hypothetical protein